MPPLVYSHGTLRQGPPYTLDAGVRGDRSGAAERRGYSLNPPSHTSNLRTPSLKPQTPNSKPAGGAPSTVGSSSSVATKALSARIVSSDGAPPRASSPAGGGRWIMRWLVANRATLPQKWPPPPPGMDQNVAGLCELTLLSFEGQAGFTDLTNTTTARQAKRWDEICRTEIGYKVASHKPIPVQIRRLIVYRYLYDEYVDVFVWELNFEK